MANAIQVTDESGKTLIIMTSNIATIEAVPGKPGEPAVEAADEVPDDPGEEPNLAVGNLGRPPTKGHPKVEAKAAVAGVPDKAIIKLVAGGDVHVQQNAQSLFDAVRH